MTTVAKSFTEVGVSAEFTIKPGESATYSVSGTFTGFVNLERSRRSGVWENLVTGVEDTGFTGTLKNELTREERYRFRALDTDFETVITGTAVCSIADAADELFVLRDKDNNVVLRVDDAGLTVNGAAAISGAATVGETLSVADSLGTGEIAGLLTTVTEHGGSGVVRQTTITFTDRLLTVTDALAYAGSKIYDFPAGRIAILGVTGSLAFGVTTARTAGTGTINDSAAMDWSLGTATASNVTLAGTMLDLLPKADKTLDGAAAAYTTASTNALAAPAQFDGTGTPVAAFLNVSFPTVTDIDNDGILKITGTITITWINLGDF